LKREIIYGSRPVVEALQSGRRKVFEIFDSIGDQEVTKAADSRGIKPKRVSRQRVDELSRGGVHQGVVARVEPYPYSGLGEILAPPEPLVLVLDGVTDPRNLGAALRAAESAGASGVVILRDRAAGVTAAAVKASAGASEHVRVARETNLRRAIEEMKEAGLWVYAAEAAGTPYTQLDLTGPIGLVFGSEGRGVRRLVREACDGAVAIPMLGNVGSLNVSVAAAVLLYEVWRQRGWP
jgi:23S rRNA (guanosine2251-2'-O)-methyltransferase